MDHLQNKFNTIKASVKVSFLCFTLHQSRKSVQFTEFLGSRLIKRWLLRARNDTKVFILNHDLLEKLLNGVVFHLHVVHSSAKIIRVTKLKIDNCPSPSVSARGLG
ncbi:hypothetical protein D3C76_1386290 [compost metagenome]